MLFCITLTEVMVKILILEVQQLRESLKSCMELKEVIAIYFIGQKVHSDCSMI